MLLAKQGRPAAGLLNAPFFRERTSWKRTGRKTPCPVCGRWGWCELSAEGELAHCMYTPGDREIRWRGGGWIHKLKVGLPGNRPVEREQPPGSLTVLEPEIRQLSPEISYRVFKRLIGICPISDQHRAYLAGEGVPEEFILNCGSLHYARGAAVAGQLVKEFGEEVARCHPALLKVSAGTRNWWTLAGAADGLLFPATGYDGSIRGIQLRKDRPHGPNDRYRWLSHGGLGGTPLAVFRAGEGAASPHHLIITEGYKKAAVASYTWGCQAISLAGVSAYRESELIQTVEALSVSSISLAFDRDKLTNPRVREAEQKLLRLLAAVFPAIELYCLEWDMPHNEASPSLPGSLPSEVEVVVPKGLDDALKAGAIFRFDRAVLTGPRFVPNLPAEAVARNFANTAPLYTLEQARRQHRQLLDRKILHPDGSKTVITSTTGTGKSLAADEALAAALLEGNLPHRVLLLCPDKENIRERTRPLTLLGKAVASGLAVIQRGRRLIDLSSPPPSPEPEDCANSQAMAAGIARHAAARFICRDCPFASDNNWQKAATGRATTRPFCCEITGYLASRKRSGEARAVIATKEAYLNNSQELGRFEVVICDEELLPYLLESNISIDSGVLRGWQEKISHTGIYAPRWQKLFEVIEIALTTLGQDKAELRPGRLVKVQPYLEQVAAGLGENLDTLADECEVEAAPPAGEMARYEAFDFETPYFYNGTRRLPYRAAAALLRSLSGENSAPPYAVKGPDGSFRLEIVRVRDHLVELLKDKTLVVLDSTLPPQLKMLLPELKEQQFAVPQNQRVIQITGALYSKADLYNPTTRANISRAIRAFAGEGDRHLTVVPLRFEREEEALELPPEGQVEHWGRHRATNRFSGLDSLALVGHHLRPVDRLEAEVRAIQSFLGEEPASEVESGDQAGKKFRLYNHLDREGKGAGLWRKSHLDPLVQAAIEHDYASHIIQAIGRLRTALRPAHLEPARILVLCNEPVGDLRVDELTTTGKIATNPAKYQDFSNNIYEKTFENRRPVVVAGELEKTQAGTAGPELLREEPVVDQINGQFWKEVAFQLTWDHPDSISLTVGYEFGPGNGRASKSSSRLCLVPSSTSSKGG